MTERSSEGLDERRKKLLFRAWRRGVRETDLIVGRFADAHIGTLDEPSLDDFERLIEVPNSDLYAWVSGENDIPSDYDTAVLMAGGALPAAMARARSAMTKPSAPSAMPASVSGRPGLSRWAGDWAEIFDGAVTAPPWRARERI
jgi:antitoxin CptB